MGNSDNWRQRLYVMIFQTDTVAGRRFDSTLLLIILHRRNQHVTPRLILIQREGDLYMDTSGRYYRITPIE